MKNAVYLHKCSILTFDKSRNSSLHDFFVPYMLCSNKNNII